MVFVSLSVVQCGLLLTLRQQAFAQLTVCPDGREFIISATCGIDGSSTAIDIASSRFVDICNFEVALEGTEYPGTMTFDNKLLSIFNTTEGLANYFGERMTYQVFEKDCGPVGAPFTNPCDSPCQGCEDDPASAVVPSQDSDREAMTAAGDLHMTGFLGQKFDFTGKDNAWYCVLKDDNMQVNMRVKTPALSPPEISYITGLSIVTTDFDGADHDVVVEVRNPYSLESSCPTEVSPCLADGALAVVLDGREALLAPGTVTLGVDVTVSAVNLPGACRSFGFDKMKALEGATVGRPLREGLEMREWIISDPAATNMDECIEYVAHAEMEDGGLFAHQSEHTLFQIMTPRANIRLSHGRLHRVAMRDPTDQYDLPEHVTWQMNFAIHRKKAGRTATGILGETFVPTLDSNGDRIMSGMEAVRGTEDDYRIDGPYGVDFAQDGDAL